jgi:hypothetical protein
MASDFFNSLLVLLRHKVLFCAFLRIGVAQHGHRDRLAVRAIVSLRRIVAIELGT